MDYETGDILYKAYTLSKGNPIQDTKEIMAEIKSKQQLAVSKLIDLLGPELSLHPGAQKSATNAPLVNCRTLKSCVSWETLMYGIKSWRTRRRALDSIHLFRIAAH